MFSSASTHSSKLLKSRTTDSTSYVSTLRFKPSVNTGKDVFRKMALNVFTHIIAEYYTKKYRPKILTRNNAVAFFPVLKQILVVP